MAKRRLQSPRSSRADSGPDFKAHEQYPLVERMWAQKKDQPRVTPKGSGETGGRPGGAGPEPHSSRVPTSSGGDSL